jgi:hypothetical protein
LPILGRPAIIAYQSFFCSSATSEYIKSELVARAKGNQAAGAVPPAPAKERMWVDGMGRTTRARFKGMEGENVLLDIKNVTRPFPFEKLSNKDKDYVRAQMQARGENNPALNSSDVPNTQAAPPKPEK